jgi:hypothetical protein
MKYYNTIFRNYGVRVILYRKCPLIQYRSYMSGTSFVVIVLKFKLPIDHRVNTGP